MRGQMKTNELSAILVTARNENYKLYNNEA